MEPRPPDAPTAAAYETHAPALAALYESLAPNPRLAELVAPGGSLLDIGCGSGRDLALLTGRGVRAVGIEPCAAFREEAVRRHPELIGRIRPGFLPDGLPSLPEAPFDAVSLSAVIMHIPDAVLPAAVRAVRGLLKDGGLLSVSVPVARGGVDGATGRIEDGRLMLLRPVERIGELIGGLGFAETSRREYGDRLGRADIRWATLVFRKGAAGE